jgi:hypothetical protein
MNPDAFSELETLCHEPVPTAWRAVLTDYPEALLRAVRADDGSDTEGFVSEAELLADPAEVLRINREVRQDSILDPEGREFRWPTAFLVIGETGDGDYYCIDAAGEHDGVLQFRHHAVEFEAIADSMDEFIELLVECFVTGIDAEDMEDEDEESDDEDDQFEDDDLDDDDLDEEEPE